MTPIPISAYTQHTNKKGDPVPGCVPFETEFFKEMQRIKDGYYKDIIYKTRSIEDKKERQLFKARNLNSLTISCTCKDWRHTDNVLLKSGLMVIDIDPDGNPHINDWKEARDNIFKSPYTVCAFLSASEKGVAFVVKYVPALHLNTFQFIEWDLKKNSGITVDASGKDMVRLRFVSYDPELRMKDNFDEVPVIMPSEDFLKAKKEGFKPSHIKFSSKANSYITFSHAVEEANKHSFFEHGTKHHHMIRVASYCNRVGMDREFCLNMFRKEYSETGTPWDHIESRVKNIYSTYAVQFGTKQLPKPPYTTRELKWLLSHVDKALLKKHIYEYGQETYIGSTDYSIQVSSKLLAFLMYLISPQYTWTTKEGSEVFTNEECKDTIPAGAILDECNGLRVWCDKNYKYPLNWN